jgi:hypothetical protein
MADALLEKIRKAAAKVKSQQKVQPASVLSLLPMLEIMV